MEIRQGNKQDIPQALQLVKELAHYVKAPDKVENTAEKMVEEGFGTNPAFGFFVAEEDHEIIGLALYYYRYSTWKGKCLYLEDLIVNERHRGRGTGKLLFDKIVEKAKSEQLSGVAWQVLEGNEPAIRFYKKIQAAFEDDLLNCMLSRKQIEEYT